MLIAVAWTITYTTAIAVEASTIAERFREVCSTALITIMCNTTISALPRTGLSHSIRDSTITNSMEGGIVLSSIVHILDDVYAPSVLSITYSD